MHNDTSPISSTIPSLLSNDVPTEINGTGSFSSSGPTPNSFSKENSRSGLLNAPSQIFASTRIPKNLSHASRPVSLHNASSSSSSVTNPNMFSNGSPSLLHGTSSISSYVTSPFLISGTTNSARKIPSCMTNPNMFSMKSPTLLHGTSSVSSSTTSPCLTCSTATSSTSLYSSNPTLLNSTSSISSSTASPSFLSPSSRSSSVTCLNLFSTKSPSLLNAANPITSISSPTLSYSASSTSSSITAPNLLTDQSLTSLNGRPSISIYTKSCNFLFGKSLESLCHNTPNSTASPTSLCGSGMDSSCTKCQISATSPDFPFASSLASSSDKSPISGASLDFPSGSSLASSRNKSPISTTTPSFLFGSSLASSRDKSPISATSPGFLSGPSPSMFFSSCSSSSSSAVTNPNILCDICPATPFDVTRPMTLLDVILKLQSDEATNYPYGTSQSYPAEIPSFPNPNSLSQQTIPNVCSPELTGTNLLSDEKPNFASDTNQISHPIHPSFSQASIPDFLSTESRVMLSCTRETPLEKILDFLSHYDSSYSLSDTYPNLLSDTSQTLVGLHDSLSGESRTLPTEEASLSHSNSGESNVSFLGKRPAFSSDEVLIIDLTEENGPYSILKDKVPNRKRKTVPSSSGYFCEICMDHKSHEEIFSNPTCFHSYCNECIAKHIASKLQENFTIISCPNPSCNQVLEIGSCKPYVPESVFQRWCDVLSEDSILVINKYYCPFRDCSGLLEFDAVNDGNIRESECPYCRRLFCAQCNVPWHSEMNCEEFEEVRGNKEHDILFSELAEEKNWKRCPLCKYYVERKAGCDHMTCSQCILNSILFQNLDLKLSALACALHWLRTNISKSMVYGK
ncbi:hypothetical protein AMTR_s00129p00115010 [Amborella trichopoda]|uniref:RBR-type E3 ubiquitin transferase n=1 Tax=Amborella trichopoda TaxID=13333 RepID=W1NLE7_AMBTC|nr:hypothetical protein AMTR_s00129p00115010 [Amborella trichopoda]